MTSTSRCSDLPSEIFHPLLFSSTVKPYCGLLHYEQHSRPALAADDEVFEVGTICAQAQRAMAGAAMFDIVDGRTIFGNAADIVAAFQAGKRRRRAMR